MNKIARLLSTLMCTTFFFASCANRPIESDRVKVILVSSSLNIDVTTAIKNEPFVAHITIKEEFKNTHVMPYFPNSISIGGKELTNYYTFENGTLTIEANRITDNIKITAEAIKADGPVEIVSNTLSLSSNLICRYEPIYLTYDKTKYDGPYYSFPFSLIDVTMGTTKLHNISDYIYSPLNGYFVLRTAYTGPLKITAELISSHAVKTTNKVVYVSGIYKRVENDGNNHKINLKIDDNDIVEFVLDNSASKQPTINFNGHSIAYTSYNIEPELNAATIEFALPNDEFVNANVDINIDVPIKKHIGVHKILTTSADCFKIFNKNPIISQDRGIDIAIEYNNAAGEPAKYIIVPDSNKGVEYYTAELVDKNGEKHVSTSKKFVDGQLVFTFDKLPKSFDGNEMFLSTNLQKTDFKEPSYIYGTTDGAIDSDKVSFNFGVFGTSSFTVDSKIEIKPARGYVFKNSIKELDVINCLLKAHDKEESPIEPEKHKLQKWEIKQDSIVINDNNITAILNLRSNYSKAAPDDEYATLVFHGLNDLVKQEPSSF